MHSLTKTLSSSIQNVEIIGKNGTDGGPQEEADVSCLPVTEWSWREVARMAIINDILTDLGYSKQEAANLLKGYRSGGHPNSKEAKRWKKIEESPVAMMYQTLLDEDTSNQFRRRVIRTSLSTPCMPSSVPSDWRFFLHNIKSRSSCSMPYIQDNISKSLAALKQKLPGDKRAHSYIQDLEKCLAVLECGESGAITAPELHKAKQLVIGVLDSSRDTFSPPTFKGNQIDAQQPHLIDLTQEPTRQKMGFQKMYQISKDQFRALEQSKEEYMAAALRLKEELEMKNEDGEEEDDEDEDVENGVGGKDTEDEVPSEVPTYSSDSLKNEKYQVENTATFEKLEHSSDTKIEKDSEADDSFKSSYAIDETVNTTGHPTLSEKDSQLPTEPAEDFPNGWVVRRIPRLNPTDKRTDKNWYSPKLALRFRAKSDALRFVGLVEAANGDEVAAIVEFHGKNNTNNAANKVGSKTVINATTGDSKSGGIKAEYEFCDDNPLAPEIIRRCLAVIRSLCATNSADPFIFPVDPQLYPG